MGTESFHDKDWRRAHRGGGYSGTGWQAWRKERPPLAPAWGPARPAGVVAVAEQRLWYEKNWLAVPWHGTWR